MPEGRLKVNALRVLQRNDSPLYVFGIEGRLVSQIAAVDEARRTDVGALEGYQRARVEAHIHEIREYLEHPAALLPNSIVMAFGGDVSFESLAGSVHPEWGTIGTLTIPISRRRRGYRAGWIVDGQQRAAALEGLARDRSFPVVVVAFATESKQVQREQFVLVNRTKPLPRDLLIELLADVEVPLPRSMVGLQIASRVVRALRQDARSPFYRRVREIGERGQSSRISQAALVEVVRFGMRRNGILREFVLNESVDIPKMTSAIASYYAGVQQTWPTAWSKSPWTSRLVHGVGIVALGRIMPVVAEAIDLTGPAASQAVAACLMPIAAKCAWSSGHWDGLGRAWWELQNTASDKKLLAAHLETLLRTTQTQ